MSCVWHGLVSASTDLDPEERYADIKHAYDEELIETACMGRDAIHRSQLKGLPLVD